MPYSRCFPLWCAVTLSAVTLLAACSQAPTADDIPPSARFTTRILDNGTKLFVYSQGGRQQGSLGREGELPDARRDMPRDEERRKRVVAPDLDKGVTAMLTQNQYCRDGYVVLERYEQHGAFVMRGECRDAATAADRQQFAR